MGKRIEKAFGRDKNQSSASHHDPADDDPNRTPEPYHCTGQFQNDFSELCRRNQMVVIPQVVLRPHRPPSPPPQVAVEEKTKPGKKDDKKNQPPPPPEPEPEVELGENGEPPEQPPKTYTTRDKFEYFRPCVQVEMDNPDKLDTVTEVYIRGWKIDEPMMTIFKQCWPKLERLHTINLWNTGLTAETLNILAEFLPELINFKNLILDNNPISEENYDIFLKDESPVINLSLRYNGITDKGAELIGKALGNATHTNTKLISLNLGGNKITDKGIEHLSNGLRMNRTLLSLGLQSNKIGDPGACKLGEMLSRISLTHEEIVERRRLLSEKGAPDRLKSPPPGSRRANSRDRPGSQHSTHGGKGKSARGNKKDTKGKEDEKHDKTKGKKEQDKPTKKASVVADTGKTTKKGDKTKGKKSLQAEQEPVETPEVVNPLLDTVEKLDNGVTMMLAGNRALINLNVSNNEIGEEGVKALLLAVGYQTSIAQFPSQVKTGGTGLMRICINRNKVSRDNENLQKLNNIMLTKDPFYKPPPSSPDQELQAK